MDTIQQNWNTEKTNQSEFKVDNLPSNGVLLKTNDSTMLEFKKLGEPFLSFKENGDIFVHGRLVENDKEVVEGMRKFLKTTGII